MLSGHVTIKRRVAADQLAQIRFNSFAVIHQNAIHNFFVRRAQAVPVRLVSVRRAGSGKALFVGQQWAQRKIGKRRVVVVMIMIKNHVRQLQPAAILHRRTFRLALRVKPF